MQMYNVLQLGELFDYLAGSFQHVMPAPVLIPLYEPAYLSIRVLPARVKEIARQRLLAERSKASCQYTADPRKCFEHHRHYAGLPGGILAHEALHGFSLLQREIRSRVRRFVAARLPGVSSPLARPGRAHRLV